MLTQAWPKPSRPRPIVLIGCGGIARDAHLPAYQRMGFLIAGVFDIDRSAAEAAARTFRIDHVYDSLEAACSAANAVFDVAVPGDRTLGRSRDVARWRSRARAETNGPRLR